MRRRVLHADRSCEMNLIDMTMTRGDTPVFPFSVYTTVGAYNITGCSFWFTAKRKVSDLDAQAIFQKTEGSGITITNGAGGLAEITLLEADTKSLANARTTLLYDLQMKTAAG